MVLSSSAAVVTVQQRRIISLNHDIYIYNIYIYPEYYMRVVCLRSVLCACSVKNETRCVCRRLIYCGRLCTPLGMNWAHQPGFCWPHWRGRSGQHSSFCFSYYIYTSPDTQFYFTLFFFFCRVVVVLCCCSLAESTPWIGSPGR